MPIRVTRSGSHIRDSLDLKRVMIVVVVALLPALLFGMYNTGLQHFRAMGVADAPVWTCFWFGFLKVLPIIIVSYVVGLGIERISFIWYLKNISLMALCGYLAGAAVYILLVQLFM